MDIQSAITKIQTDMEHVVLASSSADLPTSTTPPIIISPGYIMFGPIEGVEFLVTWERSLNVVVFTVNMVILNGSYTGTDSFFTVFTWDQLPIIRLDGTIGPIRFLNNPAEVFFVPSAWNSTTVANQTAGTDAGVAGQVDYIGFSIYGLDTINDPPNTGVERFFRFTLIDNFVKA